MIRDHDALLREIAKRALLPFDWATNDCVRYAGACVTAQTGYDPLGGLHWSTEEEARRLLDQLGGMEAATDSRLRRIAPAMAMRGDVAGVIDPELGLALMIVEGVMLVGPGERSEKRLPRRMMATAWSAEP